MKDMIHPNKSVTEKAKNRLVVRIFQQVQRVNFDETYGPVVKFTSVRIVLSLCACLDLERYQMDVVTAFRNGDLDEEIYMEVFQGVKFNSSMDVVCKSNKALYGLKQAPSQ